jgi:hypothetical protein
MRSWTGQHVGRALLAALRLTCTGCVQPNRNDRECKMGRSSPGDWSREIEALMRLSTCRRSANCATTDESQQMLTRGRSTAPFVVIF